MKISLIGAFCNDFIIGCNNTLPWDNSEDMKFFREMTLNKIIIMGKNTFESMNSKGLKNRFNIILHRITHNHVIVRDGIYCFHTTTNNLIENIKNNKPSNIEDEIFVIGGAKIYNLFLDNFKVDEIYLNVIKSPILKVETECVKFPYHKLTNKFRMISYTKGETVNYMKFVRLEKETDNCYEELIEDILKSNDFPFELQKESFRETASDIPAEKSIQNIEQEIATEIPFEVQKEKGIRRDRTKVGTIGVFGKTLRYNLQNGFPLITTKLMGWKSIMKELLFFLRGDTNTKILEQPPISVTIWKGNTTREFLDNRGLHDYPVGEMGPMYGYVWRHYGKETGKEFDQLEYVIDLLKNDPYSRRIIMTTYSPLYLEKSVLMPCHGIVVQFYVSQFSPSTTIHRDFHDEIEKASASQFSISSDIHDNPRRIDVKQTEEQDNINQKNLSLLVYCRSQDVALGTPYNIASYAMMLHIVAKKVDMQPYELIMNLGDTHIYSNHIENTIKQIKNNPYPFPIFNVSDDVKTKDWNDLSIDDFSIDGYYSHEKINYQMAI
jgi:thymidylate synthase/dihydrofolate reductase